MGSARPALHPLHPLGGAIPGEEEEEEEEELEAAGWDPAASESAESAARAWRLLKTVMPAAHEAAWLAVPMKRPKAMIERRRDGCWGGIAMPASAPQLWMRGRGGDQGLCLSTLG
jgi:hypothetical protein